MAARNRLPPEAAVPNQVRNERRASEIIKVLLVLKVL